MTKAKTKKSPVTICPDLSRYQKAIEGLFLCQAIPPTTAAARLTAITVRPNAVYAVDNAHPA